MISALRREIKDRNSQELKEEIDILLANEEGYEMNEAQKKIYKEMKKLLKDNHCKLISGVYINCKTKLVFECLTDNTHQLQAATTGALRQRAKKQKTCCPPCNCSLGTKKARKRKLKSEIKAGKSFKKMKMSELGEEGAIKSYVDFLASDKSVAEKKELIVNLNTNKGKNRLFTCIVDKCMHSAGYGYKDLPFHCYNHKLNDEKNISNKPCQEEGCTITGTIEIDGYGDNKYCLKHAVPRGHIPQRKWHDGLTDEEISEARQMKYGIKASTWVGHETEKFMFDLLQSKINNDNYHKNKNIKIECTGHQSHCLTDLEISFEDAIPHGIQIRTINNSDGTQQINCTRVDTSINKHKKIEFPEDMLIIATNPERSLFVCIYSQEAENGWFRLSKENLIKFKKRIFNNANDFVARMIKMAKNAIVVDDNLKLRGKCLDKEYKMLQKLKRVCESKNLPFELNSNYASPIDCIINGNNIQCKFSSTGREHHTFGVRSCSKLVLKSGQKISAPYHLDDNIDAFIVQIQSQTNKKKYKNDFMIIPKSALISLNIIQTQTQYGKIGINVPSPDYDCSKREKHPLSEFWNKYDILTTKGNGINEVEVNNKSLIARGLYRSFEEEKRMEEIQRLNKSLTKLEKSINNGKVKRLETYFEDLHKYLQCYGYKMSEHTSHNQIYYEIYKRISKQKPVYVVGTKIKEESLLSAQKYLITKFLKKEGTCGSFQLPSIVLNLIASYIVHFNFISYLTSKSKINFRTS